MEGSCHPRRSNFSERPSKETPDDVIAASRVLIQHRYSERMIMHVVVKQAPPKWAPCVAKSILFKAWAESGLPEAPRRLEGIKQDMRSHDITTGFVSYSLLLKF